MERGVQESNYFDEIENNNLFEKQNTASNVLHIDSNDEQESWLLMKLHLRFHWFAENESAEPDQISSYVFKSKFPFFEMRFRQCFVCHTCTFYVFVFRIGNLCLNVSMIAVCLK